MPKRHFDESATEPTAAEPESADAAAFDYKATGDGKVFISWRHRHVVTLTGHKASTFLYRISGADEAQAQLLMARATGNFRRGNELNGSVGSGS